MTVVAKGILDVAQMTGKKKNERRVDVEERYRMVVKMMEMMCGGRCDEKKLSLVDESANNWCNGKQQKTSEISTRTMIAHNEYQ